MDAALKETIRYLRNAVSDLSAMEQTPLVAEMRAMYADDLKKARAMRNKSNPNRVRTRLGTSVVIPESVDTEEVDTVLAGLSTKREKDRFAILLRDYAERQL